MPELPEVQALAERLDEMLSGSAFAGAVPFAFSALKTFDPPPESLVGRVVGRVGRRGKFLVFEFDGDGGETPSAGEEPGTFRAADTVSPRPRMLLHLSQAGRPEIEPAPKTTRPRGAVVRLGFEGRPAVLIKEYGTERKAGWWVLAPGDPGPLAKLGPEPDSGEFARLVRTGDDRRRIHTMLRDQRTVAGIGRGYSDDILHRAELSPYATLASLTEDQRETLLDAVRAVLEEALDVERRRTGGLPPKLGEHFTVHGRYGTPCPRCGGDLRRVSYESHEVTYCPHCQTGGKVLADRRLSRLLK
ncbi:MAG: DNA-formamidopyrimidine glycosylase family protein [Actinomycetota bacterium]